MFFALLRVPRGPAARCSSTGMKHPAATVLDPQSSAPSALSGPAMRLRSASLKRPAATVHVLERLQHLREEAPGLVLRERAHAPRQVPGAAQAQLQLQAHAPGLLPGAVEAHDARVRAAVRAREAREARELAAQVPPRARRAR